MNGWIGINGGKGGDKGHGPKQNERKEEKHVNGQMRKKELNEMKWRENVERVLAS
jgi:hypothetical protein